MDMSKRALSLTLLGMLAYNLVVSLDSTALSVILPVRCAFADLDLSAIPTNDLVDSWLRLTCLGR